MQLPANLQSVRVPLPVVGAGLQAAVTALAAPGAGVRYRTWAWIVVFDTVTQLPLRTWWGLTSGGTVYSQCSTAGFAGAEILIPGGYPTGENALITAFSTGELASVSREVQVYYTVEAV